MNDANVVVTGNGIVDTELGDKAPKGLYGFNVYGSNASLTIENGTFYGAPSAVQVQQGNLIVKGGSFDMSATCKKAQPENAKYIINCVDGAFKDGTAKISVKGGTFVGYNPSDNPEGPGTSYLDKNYTATTDASGNFKVVVDEAKAEAQIGNIKYATFDDAVAAAKAGEKIQLLADANVTKAFNNVTVLAGTHKVTLNGLTNAQFDNVVFEGGNLEFKGTKATFNNNTTIMKNLVSLSLDATTNLDVNVANDTKAINVVGDKTHTPYAVTIPQGAVLDLHGKELWLAKNLDAQDYSKNNFGDGPLRRGTVKGVVQEEHNSEEVKKQTNFFVLMDEGFYRATRKIGPGEGLTLPSWNSDPEFLGWYGLDEKLQHNVLMPTTYTFNTNKTYIIPSVYAKKADRKVSEKPYAITGVEELNGITVESAEIKNAVNTALQNEGKESFKNAARELVKKMPVQRPDSLYVTADANVSVKATKTGEGYVLKPVYVVNTSQKGNTGNTVALGNEKPVVTNGPTTISFKITKVFDGKNIFITINGKKTPVTVADGIATFTSETGIPAEGLTLTTEIDRVPVDAVIKQINDIGTVEYTKECKAKIDAAQKAYKALTADQKKLVTNIDVWQKADAKYKELEAAHRAELAKVAPLVERVMALGEITLEDSAEVKAIRDAYNALESYAKDYFQNYNGVNYLTKLETAENTIKALEKAEADKAVAQVVINQINAIGKVEYTKECKDKIDAAQKAYKALTADQKKLVTNIDVWQKADAKYKELEAAHRAELAKVAPLVERVMALGEITLEDSVEVKAIRDAYNALESYAKDYFQNYNGVNYLAKLEAAEAKLAELEKAEADKAAAQKVIDQINAIGKVEYTKECKDKILTAQDAYNALTPEQQKLVTNVNVLEQANAEYAELEKAHARPEKPQNVKVRTDYGLFKVTAEKVKGVSYRVAYRVKGTKAWTYVNSKDNEVIIKAPNGKLLEKNTKYEIRVALVNVLTKERSDYDKTGFFYTNRGGNRSGCMFYSRIEKAYTKNGAVKLTARNIKYKTSPQTVKYKFAYRVKGTKTWKYTTYSPSNIKTIKGLKKGKTYTFAVAYSYKSAVDNSTYIYSKYGYKNVKIK